ncbi:MAG: glycosyltransferase family 4 protein [Desulfobacteraceae bacterium]|nr:glycosyltransferase family 4 protein [Desulfobacteraceae bacterium]
MHNDKYRLLIVMRWPVGGIRTFCKYVYNYFDPDKYSFTIMAPDTYETKELMNDLYKFNPSFIPITRKNEELDKFFKIRVPVHLIYKEKFDLIYSHGISAGLLSAIPAYLLKISHIMTIHETLTTGPSKNLSDRFRKILFSLTLPLINIIHHVSYDARKNILDNIPVLKYFPKKHIVIQNGINVQQFVKAEAVDFGKQLNLPDNRFLIGFFGRFMPEKGFKYLVEAIEILSKKKDLLKEPVVLAYGWGAFIREEQEIIKKKKLDNYFRFMPFTSNVASSLKGLDVVAVPSLREAFGLIAAEALTAGVPVIGTNCIGLKEVLQDTPATVVPPGDSVALSDSLMQEMYNPSKEKAINFANTASKRFDVFKQAERLEAEIIKLI